MLELHDELAPLLDLGGIHQYRRHVLVGIVRLAGGILVPFPVGILIITVFGIFSPVVGICPLDQSGEQKSRQQQRQGRFGGLQFALDIVLVLDDGLVGHALAAEFDGTPLGTGHVGQDGQGKVDALSPCVRRFHVGGCGWRGQGDLRHSSGRAAIDQVVTCLIGAGSSRGQLDQSRQSVVANVARSAGQLAQRFDGPGLDEVGQTVVIVDSEGGLDGCLLQVGTGGSEESHEFVVHGVFGHDLCFIFNMYCRLLVCSTTVLSTRYRASCLLVKVEQ